MKRILFIILGCIGLGLGALGAALPLLPAFPFLLLAAFCFAKSSERLHTWFINTKLYKNNLESFVRGKGMTLKTKIKIMAIVTLTMSVGFIMMSRVPIGRMILAAVWVFHMFYFLFGIKTIPANETYKNCHKIKLEGLECENCAKRLECTLNNSGQMKASVDFQTQTAIIYLNQPLEATSFAQIVTNSGYQISQICNHH